MEDPERDLVGGAHWLRQLMAPAQPYSASWALPSQTRQKLPNRDIG